MAGEDERSNEPPDGGWGWVVVIGGFTCLALAGGTYYSFGVLYVAFLDAFEESKAKTAWVSSVFTLVLIVTNSIAMALARKIGHRRTTMLGGVVAFIGLLSSSYATSLTMVIFTFGVGAGVGLSLSYMTSLDIVSKYFKRRLPLALSLTFAGTGFGQFAMSLICQYLLDMYGWRGMLMVLSALALNLCVAGATFRPLRENTKNEVSQSNGKGNVDSRDNDDSSDNGHLESNTSENQSTSTNSKHCCLAFISTLWDLSLFRQPGYLIVLLTCCGQGIAMGTVLVHIVSRAVDYGIPNNIRALIPAVMGLTQAFARPLFGAIGNIKKVKPHIAYGTSMAICGISSLVSIYTTTFTGQTIFIIVFGLFMGCFTVFMAIVIAFYFGREKVGYGVSLCFQIQGLATLLIAPLAGWIRDESGVYDGAFWMAGIALILSAILAFFIPIVDNIVRRRHQQHNVDDDTTLAHKGVQCTLDCDSEEVT